MSRSFNLAVATVTAMLTAGVTASSSPITPRTMARALAPSAPSEQAGGAFTYQGQLRKSGRPLTGTCDASFYLYTGAQDGYILGSVFSPSLYVRDGLFTIALDFGAAAFNGEARWLETEVGCDETPVTLSPRTRLNPAPYALALPGMRTVPGNADPGGQPTINVIGGVVTGTWGNTISEDSYNSAVTGGNFNAVLANSTHSAIAGGRGNGINIGSPYGAVAGGYGNQITDNAPYGSIGGGDSNLINQNSHATVAGGGFNKINGDSQSAAIGGGSGNTVSGNSDNAVIAGGLNNVITGTSYSSAVLGGDSNRVDQGDRSVIAGGASNTIERSSSRSAIGGGQGNRVSGNSALGTIGGGSENLISRTASYAAIPGGRQAAAISYGQYAFASGSFGSTPGQAQHAVYVARNTTGTNTNWIELYLDAAIQRIKVPAHRAMIFYIQVVGWTQDDWIGAWEFRGTIKNTGFALSQGCAAATCFVTPPTKTVLQPMAAGEDAQLKADAANEALVVEVRGNVFYPMHWVATVYATEVGW